MSRIRNQILSNWHDLIFAVGGVLLMVAAIPAIFGEITTPLWTALLFAVVIFIYALNSISMRLWWTALTMFVQSGLWFVVVMKLV